MDVATITELQQSAPPTARRFEQTSGDGMAALELTLRWHSDEASHTDCLVAEELDLWRDPLPPELEDGVIGQPIGHVARHRFAPGELLAPYRAADCLRLPAERFDRRRRAGIHVEPRLGRFYPRGFIAGVRGILPQDLRPFRVAALDPELVAELNHPLADREVEFGVRVLDAWDAGDQHAGRCNDIGEMMTLGGPGMQARWRGRPTDFFSGLPFVRAAAEPDDRFYARPRLVNHLDRTATAQVSALYGRLIEPGSRVLDLMSSWKSHLPDDLETGAVIGLGMNREELAANPRLAAGLVHDLNLAPRLPFDDAEFDAVICNVSVEYLTEPFEVFAEVQRVLRPGGRFILSFSNRWFPPKVIRAWETAHEFERPGLVLEYFHRSGGFRDLQTFSIRGLPRPADDPYAGRLAHSDPVYAVWGGKGG